MATTRRYEVLSGEQKRILSTFYESGMTSTATAVSETIQKAADEVGTTFEKVKVCILFIPYVHFNK